MPSPSVSLGWLAGHSMHILDESQHLWVFSEPVVFGSVQEVVLPVLVQVSGIPDCRKAAQLGIPVSPAGRKANLIGFLRAHVGAMRVHQVSQVPVFLSLGLCAKFCLFFWLLQAACYFSAGTEEFFLLTHPFFSFPN